LLLIPYECECDEKDPLEASEERGRRDSPVPCECEDGVGGMEEKERVGEGLVGVDGRGRGEVKEWTRIPLVSRGVIGVIGAEKRRDTGGPPKVEFEPEEALMGGPKDALPRLEVKPLMERRFVKARRGDCCSEWRRFDIPPPFADEEEEEE
jgi:hypothetical protein